MLADDRKEPGEGEGAITAEEAESLTEIVETEHSDISHKGYREEVSLNYINISSKNTSKTDEREAKMDPSLGAAGVSVQDFADGVCQRTITAPLTNGISYHLPDPDLSERNPPRYIATVSSSSHNGRISRTTVSSSRPLTHCPSAKRHLWSLPTNALMSESRVEQASKDGLWRLKGTRSVPAVEQGPREPYGGIPFTPSSTEPRESIQGYTESNHSASLSSPSKNHHPIAERRPLGLKLEQGSVSKLWSHRKSGDPTKPETASTSSSPRLWQAPRPALHSGVHQSSATPLHASTLPINPAVLNCQPMTPSITSSSKTTPELSPEMLLDHDVGICTDTAPTTPGSPPTPSNTDVEDIGEEIPDLRPEMASKYDLKSSADAAPSTLGCPPHPTITPVEDEGSEGRIC